MINIENFSSNLLKIDEKPYKNIGIHYIGHITIKNIDEYENIQSLNPVHLTIDEVNGFIEYIFIEESNGNKYLVFDSTDDKNKEVLKKYTIFGMGLKIKLRQ